MTVSAWIYPTAFCGERLFTGWVGGLKVADEGLILAGFNGNG
jgi:hypothetical protein